MKYQFDQISERDEYLILENNHLFSKISEKINRTKSLIDEYPKEWEIAKKMIHDYEYIYTSSYRKNISKISPISRSYFKFKEMFYTYNLVNRDIKNKIVCLAEAPGGFIQSINHSLTRSIENIYGITLLSEDKSVPKWNNMLKRYPNTIFEYGTKGTGDLYDFMNVISMIKKIGKSSVHLITGDGGFDYSSDYSKQEENSLKLIYSEIFLALNLQVEGGSFICKLFDLFQRGTIMLLNILRLSYKEVYIHKPKVSRYSNSEKYIVCLGYKGYNKDIISLLCHHFKENDLNMPIKKTFINNIVEINRIYCESQINHINRGIDIIKKRSLSSSPTNNQLELAMEWCEEYDIQINQKCIYLR